MRFLRFSYISVLSVLFFLGCVHSVAISKTPKIARQEIDKRVLHHGRTATARYFLNSFTSTALGPFIGNAPSSLGAVYNHAINLLLKALQEQSQASSLGFHLNHLDLSFATTNGAPIPWESAISFMQKMQKFLDRRFMGPEFQAFVTDIAQDVIVEVSLRLLLDSPLSPIFDDDD
ncbi:MAG: hypothetical protein Q9207_004092 [Kuettlingeria erythrocarpa]